MSAAIDVLVVGAGPTGLALASQAHDHLARVRVVERRPERFRPSRALIVHPRSLEVLRPLGVTEALLERGELAPSVRLHLGSRVLGVELGKFAIEDTAFPNILFERQADVEAVLSQALARREVAVERGTELVDLRPGGDGVEATLSRAGRQERLWCRYVAGCDGSASTVRRLAGVGWRGGRYRQEVVLADLELEGDIEAGVAHAVAGRDGVLFVFAAGERATWRLLATRASGRAGRAAGEPGAPLSDQALQALLDDAGLAARITGVAWSARVPLEHRIASAYRRGPLFLVGDAAHVHSPAGGQGMNTGIQDATNLGWKLAFAARADADKDVHSLLLDSYELERRPVAQRVLALTHLLFWAEASLDPAASLLRRTVVPVAAPVVSHLLRRPRVMAAGVRVLSQLSVNYRKSDLSVDGARRLAPGPRPGDRLPDRLVNVAGRPRHLHEMLAHPGVHLLVEGESEPLGEDDLGALVHVHRLTSPRARVIGVRPDGYIGLETAPGDDSGIRGWLSLIGAPQLTDSRR